MSNSCDAGNSCNSWIVFLCDSNAIHEIHELLITHHPALITFLLFTFHFLKKLALIPTESVWQM